jgi:hypothetical protein
LFIDEVKSVSVIFAAGHPVCKNTDEELILTDAELGELI